MKVVGVIPARWASTRLPGKSLISICGKPLIQWVVENARKASRLDALLVATDDARIAEAVASLGVRAVWTRKDHPTGTDRVAEAVADTGADLVVNIQGDEPLLDPELVNRLVAVMEADERWDMATAATALATAADIRNPSVVKVVWDAEGRALYFSRAAIPHVRDPGEGSDDELYYRHLGIYGYRAPFLRRLVATPPCAMERAEKLEQLRALYIGARMAVVKTEDRGIGVDTPADVEYVEQVIQNMQGV